MRRDRAPHIMDLREAFLKRKIPWGGLGMGVRGGGGGGGREGRLFSEFFST